MTSYTLTAEAEEDLIDILAHLYTADGEPLACACDERLDRRFTAVANGLPGRRRTDVHSRRPLLFTREGPYLIAFDPDTWVIVRIVHGLRDFPSVFAGL